jgi:hypothetical protein
MLGMVPTLQDLDRRVTALEKAAEREQSLERAVAEVVAESEKRLRNDMSTLRVELQLQMKMSEQRLEARISEEVRAAKRDMIDLLNDRFDQVMTALDRPKD